MADLLRQQGVDVWTIVSRDGGTRAAIVPELGAAVASLEFPGTGDVLFRHPHFWDPASEETRGGIPFLFPSCGRVRADGSLGVWRRGNQTFRLPIHGFAMRRPWVVLDHRRPDELLLGQIDGPDTRALYPHHFEVVLRFRVEADAFRCEQTYTNRGEEPIPFSAGFHPYFRTPPPGGGKERITVELAVRRRRCYDGTYTAFRGDAPPPAGPIGVGDPLFSDCLHEVDGACAARVRGAFARPLDLSAGSPDDPAFFPYLQLYTTEESPFVCVEPWTGAPNALNTGETLRWLAPGQVERAWFQVAAGN
jgi:galactose mutarotase-like enzyme